MIDLSTDGIEKNIGMIRDIGLNEAIERFKNNGQGDEGIVALLDADTLVEPRYVEKIVNQFLRSEIETLFLNLNYFILEGDENLFSSTFQYQYQVEFGQWLNTLLNTQIEVGAPQIVAKVGAYKKVGGIPHLEISEDFQLSFSLSEITNFKFCSDIRIYTSDRARKQGYDSRIRLENLKKRKYLYLLQSRRSKA
ncbi:MAG: hypothetical protein NZL96_03285 [Patescibacteria group bacterium]|nr:hypothetical protein [Patescibacteria group bacterium]